MPEIRTFRDLAAWNASVEMVLAVYKLTESFPRSEMFGLVSQLRHAAVSIPANIAEGNSRYSTQAHVNHVHMALGSHGELRALLEISSRLRYVEDPETARITSELDEVGRLLSGLRCALKQRVDRDAVSRWLPPIPDP